MPLSPEDVANKQFTSTRLGRGYDEAEVDDFLDEVEAELTRLSRENEELRGKLSQCQRALSEAQARLARGEGAPATGAHPVAVPTGPHAISVPTGPHPVAVPTGQHAVAPAPVQAQPEPAPAPPAPPAPVAAPEQAAGILALAQRTADEHVAEARTQADRIVSEARTRAEALIREAEERQRQVLGTLESERSVLERKVDDLRSFERDYRARLKSFISGQLQELDSRGGGDNGEGRGFAPVGSGGGHRADESGYGLDKG
ncbi:DivIVA domain-containing protein [Motilibacter aurantiacus]|uniref:DivIVA domain-containing protein n=1 Tax=Motilibacter aurantiacus TaxID=2714955 RepID=UPI00140B80FB|nr:DivIVA domain-containing protein [Motilibacter aurantiacus]NHC45537.1 DivIVA domain-containing protein [Motilibacter aurantiacus]